MKRVIIIKTDGALALCADNNGLIGWVMWRDIVQRGPNYYI